MDFEYGLILKLLEEQKGTIQKKSQQGDRVSCCCPFHEDRTPSFSIELKSNVFKCFGCGISGGVKELCELLDVNFESYLPEKQPIRKDNNTSTIVKNVSPTWFYPDLKDTEKNYLQKRNISIEAAGEEVFSIDPNVSSYTKSLYADGYTMACVSFNHDKSYKFVKFRNTVDKLPKAKNIFRDYGLKPALFGNHRLAYKLDYIIILEGEIDYYSCLTIGELNVIAVPSAMYNFQEEEIDALPNKVFLLLDSDEVGRVASLKLARQIYRKGRVIHICSYPTTNKKKCDFNDILTNDGIDKTKSLLDEILRGSILNVFSPVETTYNIAQDILKKMESKLAEAHALGLNRPEPILAKTGIESIDVLLNGGFRPGLYGLAGKPGVGKTSFVLSMVKSLASQDASSLIISLEMKKEELTAQILSWMSGIGKNAIIDYSLDDHGVDLLRATLKENGEILWRIIINDEVKSVNEIKKLVIDTVNELEEKVVVFIDYLQQIRGFNINEQRLHLKEVSRELKDLAKTYELPVIAISSIPREMYKTKENEKTDLISVFKESGDIEYSLYAALYLDEGELRWEEGKKPLRLSMVKNRFGASRDTNGDYLSVNLELDFKKGKLKEVV